MSTNSSYTVTPANNHCSSQTNTVIQQQQGSQNYNSQQSVDTTAKQQTANSQYDNVNSESIKPVQAGAGHSTKKKCTILFRKKKYVFNEPNDYNDSKYISKMILVVLNNKVYQEDNIMEILYNNNRSIYIIKGFKKNKYKKL